jgi:predicted transposase/invertase (TIGR01784 family)
MLVTDDHERVYDIEVQVANNHNLGKRMRFYQAKIDGHYTLQKGATYNNLRNSYVIFPCSFDFLGRNRLRYVFHEFEDQDRSLKLSTGATKVIINANGSFKGENKDLCDLAKLMRG